MFRAKNGATTAALLFLLCGCGTTVPEPQTASHPARALENVPYPPPAAFVELVPPQPQENAVWLDGYWLWQGRRYLWRRGGWVVPPQNARYAPWKLVYRPDGSVLFAPSVWLDEQGRKLPDPQFAVQASTPPNEITAEEQQSGQ